MVARPELASYAARLSWVKTQMEHDQGQAQANAYAPGHGKDASGDVLMGSLEGPPGMTYAGSSDDLIWALHAEKVAAGEWALAEAIENSLYAMQKGKGKGATRKGLGKGGSKGTAGPGKGESKAEFQGACNHCGIWGHRRADCRRLDAELNQKGHGKAKGGAKGGPKGGKGPLMECAEEDEYAGDDAAADPSEEAWFFENMLGSVTPYDTPADTHAEGQSPGVAMLPGGPPPTPKQQLQQAGRSLGVAMLPGGPPPATKQQLREPKPLAGRVTQQLRSSYAAVTQGKWATTQGKWTAVTPTKVTQSRRTVPVRNQFDMLSVLLDDTDDTHDALCTVSSQARGGRIVEAIVDSGAVHSVTPPELFPGRMTSSPWSRAGRGYRAANGTGIKNLGQVDVPFCTAEGHKCQIPFQVAEVEKPLLSVTHLTAAGNRVELGHTDGRVVNLKTGRSIALERRNGTYIMKMLIADAVAPAPFRRQGA